MTTTKSQHLLMVHMSIGQEGSANLGCVLPAPLNWFSSPLLHVFLILQETASFPENIPLILKGRDVQA